MAKPKTRYHCTECGAIAYKWSGQCADCGAWNSLEESSGSELPLPNHSNWAGAAQLQSLNELEPSSDTRTPIGIDELDRVLGGGLVAGSVTLLGGDPGIGKSTLLLQSLAQLSGRLTALYVTGEESLQQVALRARRLGLSDCPLRLLAETRVEAILSLAQREAPRVIVIDSVQTIFTEQLQSAPGSVSQVRESAAQLTRFAKGSGTALFLVGHVTKEGQLAGPRVLEHMVDTVLYFEGDSGSRFRLIRAVKNRFGTANELGVFDMSEAGLRGVSNPSAIFLSRHPEPVPGSTILVTLEGTRPLLVEIQALVEESRLGTPRRVAVGLEQNRLAMLLAVLHRHAGIAMQDQDVFVNAVGGVRVGETAADLPLLTAATSSLRNRAIPIDGVIFGEVGLAGEVRPVPNGELRLREAAKQGFRWAIIPKGNRPRQPLESLEVHPVARLGEALEILAERSSSSRSVD